MGSAVAVQLPGEFGDGNCQLAYRLRQGGMISLIVAEPSLRFPCQFLGSDRVTFYIAV
ncbi:hypothetical protein [Gordonia sp. KTR9]|uniref:hypothetical protein n=1 Tax=Gordonia sp. KTR9 TaxID=337191 RepID=UPI0002EFC774|nr:hypothetical protein [Gordonia sp. KTR9]